MRRRPAKLLTRALVAAALVLAAGAPAAPAASPTTGRLLVTVAPQDSGSDLRAAAASLMTADGLRRDGAQVPQIGLVSVRPYGGTSLKELARSLRRRDGVLHVEAERRHALRVDLNDPSLTVQENAAGTPSGTPVQWWIGRLGLPAAWDISRGKGATVAVIDTGVDSGHPDLSGKVQQSTDNDAISGHGPATVDENGHGTHVASIACGAGDNGVGIVGVGLDCQLLVYKSDLSDGSVARSIIQAADAKADAINMSFGTDGTTPPARVIVDAINYAIAHDVVVVAAAADSPVEEQGDPANVLQPTGTGPDITAGKGLTVTAADNAGQRSSFAGRGSQVSLAAYGSFSDGGGGPPGLLAAFPGNATELEAGGGVLFPQPGCNCRTTFQGDSRFAYLQGTSMATPMVTAVAALVKNLNPDLRAPDVVRLLKETATRPNGAGWTPDLGWGIVNPLVAMTVARTIDRRAPTSKLTGPKSVRGSKAISLRVSGADSAPGGLSAAGVDHFDIYRSANRRAYRRLAATSAPSLKVKVKTGSRYRFYSIAVDKAGNREAVPSRADVSFRVARR
ncbi:MAG TPA: S8 family serine peptidase [Solirubrobacteraceae bacterium]|nr:S8 family serine peptidase [Solirubrobacteraceae bacterium]